MGIWGVEGITNDKQSYTHASVIVFDNGARIYQIQPHPEMAFGNRANFLVRQNKWLGGSKEMGDAYLQKAWIVPEKVDYSVSSVITNFVKQARVHEEGRNDSDFDEVEDQPDFDGNMLE